MSKPNVPDAVLAERQRISKILYLSGITLPASTEAAIRSGRDANQFRLADEEGNAAEETPATAASAGKRSWSKITGRANEQQRAKREDKTEAST
jgi:hypothetical protein